MLANAAVVITGASSGIGEATALAMAENGAKLALAGRSEAALERVAAECGRRGGKALAIPTDVADEEAVMALAEQATEGLGAIDVWVNNAGVMLYGKFEDTPSGAFRQVIETNFFGQVHGSRAALGQFRRQGRGILINMSSVWGRVTSPYVTPYVVSKYAIRAFSECLRQELRDADGIDVVTILPQAVETPLWRRAANFSGRSVRMLPLALPAEDIAERIVACAQSPKRQVTDRRAGRLFELVEAIAPPLWGRITPFVFERLALSREPAAATPGNLYEPLHSEDSSSA
jgi:short-subunit dehydrogenase